MGLTTVIKQRRKTLQITQTDLAEMSGVSLATIKDIERGKGNPSFTTVHKLLKTLGLEIKFETKQTG